MIPPIPQKKRYFAGNLVRTSVDQSPIAMLIVSGPAAVSPDTSSKNGIDAEKEAGCPVALPAPLAPSAEMESCEN